MPKNGNLESLPSLLHAATALCNLEDASGQACPLCHRDLEPSQIDLFSRYYKLLVDPLATEMDSLKEDIGNAVFLATAIEGIDRASWSKYATIDRELLEAATPGADIIVANCGTSLAPTDEARAELESLSALVTALEASIESKKSAIDAVAGGRVELAGRLAKLEEEIAPMRYAQAIADSLDELKRARDLADQAQFWDRKLRAFPPLLKKVTDSAKLAHQELVAADFESRLDGEYKALAEKNMAAFGVTLMQKGAEAAVTMVPQIGGRSIEAVLSEGEQRIHALALFFAELETGTHWAVVFDDPVSSFDYNYIANYCTCLRDFVTKHPDKQVIILTHIWDFFVQLQLTLNQAGLNQQMSVQVLENCSIVEDYSEDVDVLKREIVGILSCSGEPTREQKEDLAGKTRRLIEAVVNTQVFCNQRHQFKQKNQPVSAFREFTKVVALLPEEATMLGDLYSKLSPPEHYDPRNPYVNVDKAMFQNRYNQILAIEAAVSGRRP